VRSSEPGRKNSRNWWSGGSPRELRHSGGRHAGASTADLSDQVVLLALAFRSLTLALPTACLLGIVGHKTLVIVLPDEEVATELLTFFRVLLQCFGAAVSLALGRVRAFLARHLDDERSTFNRVDEDEARLESGVRGPRTEESDGSAALVFVIFWVYVKEACFTHACACGILGDRRRVDDVQAIAVVGLVEEAVENVLVVVNGAGPTSVVSGVHWVLEIADVEDVGGWQTLGHWANLGVTLVELVVHEEVLLIHLVVDNTVE
jgi:hypothetical protein